MEKTMLDYAIYCSQEQTKKALELGAPIFVEDRDETYHGGDCFYIICDRYYCPTAEQMISWLEEQLQFDIAVECEYKSIFGGWCYFLGDEEGERVFNSRREATLAAIDAALECLKSEL